jgi:hypothetical protein
MNRYLVFKFVLIVLFGGAIEARAIIIFDSFSAGPNTYDTTTVERVEAPLPYDDSDVAFQFTVGAGSDVLLTTVEAPLQRQSGAVGTQLHFWLMTDNANSPGAIVAQTSNVTVTDQFPDSSVYSTTFPSSQTLLAGNTYWLGASADSSNTRIGWHYSFTSGRKALRENGGAWTVFNSTTINAFRLSGTAIPEPSIHALIIGTITFLAVTLWRRNRGA